MSIRITKAGVIGEQEIPDVVITIEGEPDKDLDYKEYAAFYDAEAQRLFDALRNSLPGGTFDRLLVKLMEAKVSLFRVVI